MHALRRPGLRLGLHDGRAPQGGARAWWPTTSTAASAAGTARSPARSTSPASSGSRPPPRIVKCELCRQRAGGKGPACAEVCPRGAVITGRRTDLLAEARRRLAATPSAYQGGIYGETEAGGTACLYLSPVGFEQLGLPKLGTEPAPGLSETIQHGIYQGFVAPVALYGALAIVAWKNHRSAKAGEEE